MSGATSKPRRHRRAATWPFTVGHALAGSSGLAITVAFLGGPACAQQIVANGTTQTASGTINTGVLAPPAGYALYALNGGIILSSGALTLITGGANADAARAETNGSITIAAGSVVSATGHGALANGVGTSMTVSGGAFTINGLGAGLGAIGGTLDATGITVTGSNTLRSHGAIAESGGTINLHAGTSIATGGGFNAVALGASGANSRVSADALIPVTTPGRGAMGIYMHDGGIVSLAPGSTFQINGISSVGVAVDNTTVPLGTIGNGLTINLNGAGVAGQAGSTGVVALNNGSIALQDLTVTGPNAAAGAWATAGSTITISGNSTIDINAAQNQTFYTLQTATLITASASVGSIFGVTGGTPIAGLFAFGGTINSTGTTINVTSGNGATGAEAANGGVVNMTNNTITTTGILSFGIRVDGDGQVFGRDSRVTTSGGGAALFINSAPGLIDLANSTVLATGANTAGLATLNFSAAGMNTVNLSGGSLISQQDIAVAAQGPLNLTISNGAVVTGGGGTLLGAFDNPPGFQPTVVQLNASGSSILTGDAFAEALSIANISLATGTQWTGAAFAVTNVTVDSTSRWTITADSTVTQQTTNAGTMAFTPPGSGPFKTLTTQRYVGNGGTLGLNTFLGSDGSPSDRLVLNGGSATGNSSIRVTNTTGLGALTTGNGILVVDTVNGGTTNAGAFSLGNVVTAGPYEYRLFRSSVDASNPQAWYLRSTIDCAAPGAPSPPCPAPGPQPSPPGPGPGPDPQPTPSPPIPNFRVETSLYAALPAMALLYGRNLLDTLHERVGELAFEHASDEPGRRGTWGRVIGMHGERQGDRLGIFGSGPHYEYDFLGFQIGQDLYRGEDRDGVRDYAGLYLAFGDAQGRVTHFDARTGNSDFKGYSLGAYWTHFGPTGWYVDLVVQGTWYDATSHAGRGIPALTTDGFGFAGSIEAGYPFQLGNGFFIEPQAQLVLQTIDLGDGSDGSASVRFDQVDSLAGRLGVRFGRSWRLAEGADLRRATAWLRPNLWHEFKGDPLTLFSSSTGFLPFRAHLGGTWFELNGGFSGQVTNTTTLYANVAWQTRFNEDSFSYTGKIGLRTTW